MTFLGPTVERLGTAVVVLIAVLAALGLQPRVGAQEPPRPNIVVILTDDQRADQIAQMDFLLDEVAGRGATLSRAFVANPLCCPARASILTGTYSHTNGVWTNGEGDPALGGWETFHALGHEARTVAVALDGASYRTALIGKYMNGAQEAPVPPGWDHWIAFGSEPPNYFDYTLRVDPDGQGPDEMTFEPHGSEPEDYSTDVLAAHATAFIETTPPEEPLFLYLAPVAPHAPAVAAPRHEGSMDDRPVDLGDAFDEGAIHDKPRYIRRLPRLTATREQDLIDRYRDAIETLEAVDEAIAEVVGALEDADRLTDTLIVFSSDNGFLFGEHRWKGKLVPYEESVRVPMIVRWDGVIPAGKTNPRLVSHIDIAPTLVDAAGIGMPTAVDGSSLLPMLQGSGGPVRSEALFEHARFRTKADPPSYCGIHTAADRVYVRYATEEEELYDLRSDPYQLRNLARRETRALERARARADFVCPYEDIPGFG